MIHTLNLQNMESLTGDLSKVRWPKRLQRLNLATNCMISLISGSSVTQLHQFHRMSGLAKLLLQPDDPISQNLHSRVLTRSWAMLLPLCSNTHFPGDLSKTQWPDTLQWLSLSRTNVSGDLSDVEWPPNLETLILNHCAYITGDLSSVKYPETLCVLECMETEVIGACFS